jgi:PAS domain S-box-containing protein
LQSHWPTDVLPASHSQPMHTGILGLAYEEDDQNIPNVRDPKCSSLYVKAYEETQSELCMRIKERNKVIGLLNIEDPRDNAFSRDEELALRELLDAVGKVMERIMIANLVNATFEATVTAVFVTDGSDNISIVSPSAVRLLGFTAEQMKGRPIETYLPEAMELKELCRGRKLQPRPATLLHKNGCSINVLLSASRLGGESDGMVFSAQKSPGSD